MTTPADRAAAGVAFDRALLGEFARRRPDVDVVHVVVAPPPLSTARSRSQARGRLNRAATDAVGLLVDAWSSATDLVPPSTVTVRTIAATERGSLRVEVIADAKGAVRRRRRWHGFTIDVTPTVVRVVTPPVDTGAYTDEMRRLPATEVAWPTHDSESHDSRIDARPD